MRKGLLALAVCLLLKALFLGLFPELKDPRIQLSQKQYDKYLEQLHGENTPEKSAWVQADYDACLETISRQEAMQQEYSAGELSEEEWAAYQQELNDAYLHRNASKLFTETAQRFAEQSPDLPPAHYLYEYGWETIFTLQQWPDVFLLGWLLLLAVQCFSQETASGMLPVLLAARNGRGRLFGAKLAVLLAAGLCGVAASSLLEAGIFLARGFCNDPGAPLYSVAAMDDCGLPLSLAQGYLLSLGIRGGGGPAVRCGGLCPVPVAAAGGLPHFCRAVPGGPPPAVGQRPRPVPLRRRRLRGPCPAVGGPRRRVPVAPPLRDGRLYGRLDGPGRPPLQPGAVTVSISFSPALCFCTAQFFVPTRDIFSKKFSPFAKTALFGSSSR